MKARRSILLQLLALAFAVGLSLVAWPFMRGAEPGAALLFGPALMAGVLGGTFAFIRGRNVPPIGIFGALALASLFFLGEHGMLLGGLVRGFFSVRMLMALAFGFFFGISPIIARVEQNPWFGVRTPWTLGSRRVWKETHRATGRFWLVGGILGAILATFGAPFLLLLAYLLVLVFTPVAISYRVWQRLGRP